MDSQILLYYKRLSITMHIIPIHEIPLPVNPSLYLQVYELISSLHSAFVSQRLEIHSSVSEQFHIKFMNSTKYIIDVSCLT